MTQCLFPSMVITPSGRPDPAILLLKFPGLEIKALQNESPGDGFWVSRLEKAAQSKAVFVNCSVAAES